ncbi:MAG: aminodeoxychorismate lyase [Verrucomicrobiota bacterium]
MIVFLNGRFVPEEEAVVSVHDRCFLYGDGLFETLRIYNGKPFRWEQHLERLKYGARFLKIELPFTPEAIRQSAGILIEQNQQTEAILRMTLSRGVGVRGYSTRGAKKPFLVMTLHPAPLVAPNNNPVWRLITSSIRVAAKDPIATLKTCNKLAQVFARMEAESQCADEALLLNTNGRVAEAASSNVFWIENKIIFTTPLADSALAGITRGVILELCPRVGLRCEEKSISPNHLCQAEGVFVTMTTAEIVEVMSLDGVAVKQSPVIGQLREAYHRQIRLETL